MNSSAQARNHLLVGVAIGALLLSGCAAAPPDPPPASSSPAVATTTDAPSPTTEESSATASPSPSATSVRQTTPALSLMRSIWGTPVRVDVFPIRSDGTYAALQIEFTIAGPLSELAANSTWGNLPLSTLLAQGASEPPDAVRLVDLDSGTVYQLLLSGDGRAYACAWLDDKGQSGLTASILDVDRPTRLLAAFAAPPGSRVDLSLPGLGLVTDVPVVPVSSLELELAVLAVAGDWGGDRRPGSATGYAVPLRSSLVPYDDNTVIRQSAETVTITLDSAALFASDKYEISPTAQSALRAAADQILAASDGGEVHVVGHTDDVGSAEHGYVLSRQRAEAVAAFLAPLLGEAYSLTTEGKGEDEPLIPDTTEEARAANRRVELVFAGQVGTTVTEVLPLPPTEAPTVAGAGTWVQFAAWSGLEEIAQVRVTRVVRREAGLVVDFELGAVRLDRRGIELRAVDDAQSVAKYFSVDGSSLGQVVILTPDGRLFPYDFTRPDYLPGRAHGNLGSPNGPTSPLADSFWGLGVDLRSQDDPPLHLTAVYPDSGQDTITIDLGGRFRITDIRVSADSGQLNADW